MRLAGGAEILRIFPIQKGDHDPLFVVKRVHVSANDLMGISEKNSHLPL